MSNILKWFGLVLAAVLLLDIIGFTFWAISGQAPADSFFIGTITAHAFGLMK